MGIDRLFRALAIFSILFIIGVSCSLPLQQGGGASISITVKGVAPKAARQNASRNDASSRLIFPALTASIRVRAVLSDGTERSANADYSSETLSLSLTGLPADEALDIYVESLSAAGIVITSWHESRILSGGPNQITAVLAPIIEGGAITFGAFPSSTPTAPLARNGVRFDTFNGLAAGDEVHFIYDTGRAEFARVAAYDSSWNELPPVAGGGSEGWVVVAVPADGIVNTMTRNVLSSPGYPERTINGCMQAREAVFADDNGTGVGTSASPAPISESLYINGASVFLRQGTYPNFSLAIQTAISLHIYGGFSDLSWTDQDTEFYASELQCAGIIETGLSIRLGGSTAGRLHGLHISSHDFNLTMVSQPAAVALDSTGIWVLYDCDLSGTDNSATAGPSSYSRGVLIRHGTPEISNCRIRGGSILNSLTESTDMLTAGVYIEGTEPSPNPYIHNCVIDGGSIRDSSGIGNTFFSYGVHISGSAGATIAQCKIWGGYQSYNNDNGRTTGIFNEATQPTMISSCLVTGGYCYGDEGNNANLAGIILNTSSPTNVIGCTIDGGFPEISVDNAYSIRIQTASSGTIASCLLFTLADSLDEDYGLYFAGYRPLERISGNAFFSCITGFNGDVIESLDAQNDLEIPYRGNNDYNASTSLQNEFNNGETFNYYNVSSFDSYQNTNWRPASTAIYAGSSSNEGPTTWGVFTEEMLALYPGLLLDMAGRPRPSTWARGAYEP